MTFSEEQRFFKFETKNPWCIMTPSEFWQIFCFFVMMESEQLMNLETLPMDLMIDQFLVDPETFPSGSGFDSR